MSSFSFEQHSHRRYNPFTGEYVQVSPHRSNRPWQGQQEKTTKTKGLSYDPECFLCPGNKRVGGEINPDYSDTFVFQNDFGALTQEVPEGEYIEGEFFKAKSEKGICKVLCFSPDHSKTIPELSIEQVTEVVKSWKREYIELGDKPFINYIQIFENKGEVMGCSNPHPHGQIWAQESIPDEPYKKQRNFKDYHDRKGSSMVCDYVYEELKKGERVLYENDSFVVLVPFWTIWPFETMIAPKYRLQSLRFLDKYQMRDFADAYKTLTMKYDKLFDVSFPYSAGIHQAPTDSKDHPEWDMHMVFYPPLLRSATVKKFMVGYEMLANPQRDLTAEKAASVLRAL
ncbi:Galactose-1-phosphate uridylyltransferase [Indibacter alkaliphilus LW1]|uniref:Galactose-1-phosphate uridylyltransferase n=1 Tax=Indibacter alkaliphilus (strain CCUG 57479 / KCTC 22604 / LW1) TaxID=1189612 RepID=S2CWF4_INDAL|nr:UDP-glucose--hexose-1-phosphate uridylyltransferase [Indibacter alkaliphilus]EOZ91497.1 Galactose-1-phosphate uridylyltransferase [Indibacter alkaliphilus LW1]